MKLNRESVPDTFDCSKLISIASCWEVAIKAGLGKLDLGEPSGPFLRREIASNNFDLLPISLEHATMVEGLPPHHGDPFDRLLGRNKGTQLFV